MANINQISLKVCGNPDANSGFQPMVIFNSPSIEIKDNVYAGFDANPYFFTIKIEKNQVVYTLVKNNVSSFGASRQGLLVFGIAISKGYKLDAGITPYDVLMELMKGFLARCMTCKDSATGKYEYNSNRIQPNILDDIASSFSLVSSQAPYRPMNTGGPIGYVTASEKDIKLLMNDVQYPAFTKFSEIVVATSVQNTNYTPITNISIPRIPEYLIYDDGEFRSTMVSDPKQLITINGKGDTRFYENESLMFTLEELLEGESVPNVRIDRVNETIHVNSKALKKPLTRKIKVVFVPKEAEEYFLRKRNEWILIYDNQQIRLKPDLSFEFTGEQLRALDLPQNFKIQQSRKDQYEVRHIEIKDIDVNSKELRVTVEKIRQNVYTSGGGGGTVQTTNPSTIEVQIALKETYKNRHCCVQFYSPSNVLVQSTTALFDIGKDENHIAIYVPKSWFNYTMLVRLKGKNNSWVSTGKLNKDVNGVIKLRDEDFTQESIGFFKRYSRGITILTLLLLSFLAGGTIVYFGKPFIDKVINLGPKQAETLKCSECDEIFETETKFKRHIAEEHQKMNCPDCGAGPFEQSELETHKSDCPKKVKCDVCGEGFASDSAMEAHKTSAHDTEQYVCPTCKDAFPSQTSLDSHIEKEHSPMECDICGKTLDNRTHLKKHKDKEHHFKCDECGPDVWFTTQAELDKHKRNNYVKGTKRRHTR